MKEFLSRTGRTFEVRNVDEDLAAYDRLLPLHTRLTRIHGRWDDTMYALGSDVVDTSSAVYILLRMAGKLMAM